MAQMDMGLASWTPLSEAQRMLNSLAASRQPAGAPEQCVRADKSDAGQRLHASKLAVVCRSGSTNRRNVDTSGQQHDSDPSVIASSAVRSRPPPEPRCYSVCTDTASGGPPPGDAVTAAAEGGSSHLTSRYLHRFTYQTVCRHRQRRATARRRGDGGC